MERFKGNINNDGLSSYNQCLFDNMACFSDAVWVIDMVRKEVEILYDTIAPDTVGGRFSLETLRSRIRKRYSGSDDTIAERYTIGYLSSLTETVFFNNPSFISGGKSYRQRQSMTPEFNSSGEVARVYVTCINLHNYFEESRERASLLEYFLRTYTSAYMVNLKERTFEILHMSHEFQNVFVTNGSMKDMADFIENHIHPEDRELMRRMTNPDYILERIKQEPEINFGLREIYGGVERFMQCHILRGYDDDHVAVGFLDVTDELRRERSLNAQLEAANKAKSNFLSAMSHDIRTPMNAIIGMTDIALNNTDNPQKMIDCLKKIRASGEQLLLLINDILDISAIESGKITLKPSVHDVRAGAQAILDTQAGLMGRKSLSFSVSQHDLISPWIIVDEMRLSQIINNLLSNALKYTPEGGSISLENTQERDSGGVLWTVIIVSDTGIGMSSEFMEHMWDSFSRATDTRINRIQGAGLGLSIVKQIVDLMGGVITVESRLDEGTTFTVRLPVEEASEDDIPGEDTGETTDKTSWHLLVAEDHDINWEIISDLLDLNGITCDRAANGQIAVDMFVSSGEGVYDAILMDMQMPVMNGIDATKAIRASRHPHAETIPIIAMTANAFTDDIEQCRKAGMDDHLSKPVEIEKVMVSLRTNIRGGAVGEGN